jgi:tetrahydromethanopterin S-methyltransferase subunit B
MGLAVQGWMWAVANGRLIILAGGLVIGVAVYGLVAFILRVPEAFSLLDALKARLAR